MMASSSVATSSKKRKRDAVNDSDNVSVQLSTQPKSQLGPVVVSFPSFEPPKKTSFQCYLRNEADVNAEEVEFAQRKTLIAGETDAVDFSSSPESHDASVGSRYLVGVYNKRTNTVTLRAAPLHILNRQVKALKGLDGVAVSVLERPQARAALGETFGTKKAQAAIRAAERNKVDVSAMEGVAGVLQDTIEMGTGALPTQEQAKTTANRSRLIPDYDENAQEPKDVYPLHNIIPEVEWKALSTSSLTAAETAQDRLALLPHSRSEWVKSHLQLLFQADFPNKHNLKILFYISAMLAFKGCGRLLSEKGADAVGERMSIVPSNIVDGLLTRFSETPRGSTQPQVTPQTETNLLTHIFALMLRLDGFATDFAMVADDLSMPSIKVNQLFKSLGCKIKKPSAVDLKALGLRSGESRKLAILTAPVEFPKPSTRKGRK